MSGLCIFIDLIPFQPYIYTRNVTNLIRTNTEIAMTILFSDSNKGFETLARLESGREGVMFIKNNLKTPIRVASEVFFGLFQCWALHHGADHTGESKLDSF